MSGPIVRSGPSEKFTENWESVFGSKKATAGKAKAAKKTPAKAAKKSAVPKKKK